MYICIHIFLDVHKDICNGMELRTSTAAARTERGNYRSLLQESPIRETIFRKRDLWFRISLNSWCVCMCESLQKSTTFYQNEPYILSKEYHIISSEPQKTVSPQHLYIGVPHSRALPKEPYIPLKRAVRSVNSITYTSEPISYQAHLRGAFDRI